MSSDVPEVVDVLAAVESGLDYDRPIFEQA
jgi:hypothetical protein